MQHITMVTSLAEQLRELEEEILSRKFETVILGSLPESYDNFVSILNARTAEELNWDNIKGPLIEEYMKLFQTNKGSSQIRAAIPYLTDQIRAKVSLTLICSGLPLFD